MKKTALKFAFILMSFVNTVQFSYSQTITDSSDYYQKTVVLETFNGGEFVGKILKNDEREILIETKDKGKIIIPKFEVKSIKDLTDGDLNSKGEYIGEEVFSTRYFITTNALPIRKGDHYVLWNLYGPELQFGVKKNLGLGIMTTWIGTPIVGSIKYTSQLSENSSIGCGALIGTGAWFAYDFYLGLPYGVYTYGNRKQNISFSAGYGIIGYGGTADGNVLLAVAGMKKVGKKISLVFDSFILPQVRNNTSAFDPTTNTYYNTTTYSPVALLLPGIRVHGGVKSAFQFGFAGIYADNNMTPLPIPFLQWYVKL